MVRTIRSGGERETLVKGSRFLGAVEPAPDEATARAFIAARRKRHWDATHNCTAYILGWHRDIQRSSDDGEPAGTAGAPMLEVLRGRRLTDIVAVVTRYFGGVKLGSGGLIRAYGNALATAIDAIGVIERRELLVQRVTTDHAHGGRLGSGLREAGYHILDTHYAAEAAYDVAVPPEGLAELASLAAEFTAGGARLADHGTTTVDLDDA